MVFLAFTAMALVVLGVACEIWAALKISRAAVRSLRETNREIREARLRLASERCILDAASHVKEEKDEPLH